MKIKKTWGGFFIGFIRSVVSRNNWHLAHRCLFLVTIGIFFICCIKSFAIEKSTRPHLVIVINIGVEGESAFGNLDLSEADLFESFKDQFPNSYPIFIRGQTNDEVKRALELNVLAHDVVDALIISSHGRSGIISLYTSINSKVTFQTIPSMYAEIFSIKPNSFRVVLGYSQPVINNVETESFKTVFGPIIGKFSTGAKIIFDGCKLLSAGTMEDKLKLITNVARNFELKSGSVYMNETKGTSVFSKLLRQPVSSQNTTAGKIDNAFAKTLAMFTIPMYLAADYIIFNRGFLLDVFHTNPKTYSLSKDSFYNALKNRSPKGRTMMRAVDDEFGFDIAKIWHPKKSKTWPNSKETLAYSN